MRLISPLAVALLLAVGSPALGEDAAANCAKAEARYREIIGKAPAQANPQVVLLYNYAFCPAEVSARKGSVLRFFNVDKRTSHSVWFRAAGRPESERFFGSEHVDVTLDLEPGSHEVLCGPHWEHQNMRGVVIVVP